ncbi:MAG: hypothetical protein KJ779_05555 [Firmicutes bacterium]|nr:hypothetical protein [Bacillota bacterium]
MNEKENLKLSVDKSKADELLEKLSQAIRLVEELNVLLDSIKQFGGLFKT